MKKIIITLTLLLSLSGTFIACGGGGGGGGSSLKDSIVLIKTNFGYCMGTTITATSVLTSAACVYDANYITVIHKNGTYNATNYYYPTGFNISSHYYNYRECILSPYNVAIVKIPASFSQAIGASSVPLKYSETIYPNQKLSVWGFGGYEKNIINLNEPKSIDETFASFENNAFQVTTMHSYPLDFEGAVFGGHPSTFKDGITGIKVCGRTMTSPRSFSFLSVRHDPASSFIESIAPDMVTKASIEESIKSGLVVERTLNSSDANTDLTLDESGAIKLDNK